LLNERMNPGAHEISFVPEKRKKGGGEPLQFMGGKEPGDSRSNHEIHLRKKKEEKRNSFSEMYKRAHGPQRKPASAEGEGKRESIPYSFLSRKTTKKRER